jgi:hypothetical protein
MKKLTLIAFACLLAVFVLQGCEKANQDFNAGKNLKATKSQIGVWDLDTLVLTSANSTDSLKWTISPAGNEHLYAKGNKATISFNAPGTYVVTAQKPGEISASTTIKVSATVSGGQTDSITTKSDLTTSTSDTLQVVPITNDVTIAVSYYRNPTGDKVMINLMPYVYLDNYYCRKAIMQFKSALTADNHFNLHLVNMRQAKGCTISSTPAPSSGPNTVFVNKLIGFGTYPLKITVGSVVYTGSIVVTASNVTFIWPYTSGVVFPTKVIGQ